MHTKSTAGKWVRFLIMFGIFIICLFDIAFEKWPNNITLMSPNFSRIFLEVPFMPYFLIHPDFFLQSFLFLVLTTFFGSYAVTLTTTKEGAHIFLAALFSIPLLFLTWNSAAHALHNIIYNKPANLAPYIGLILLTIWAAVWTFQLLKGCFTDYKHPKIS